MKRMTLLARREGMQVAAFRDHWAGAHAQLALSLKGVCKYTQNRADETLLEISNGDPFAVDGIVELFFTDEAAMARDQATETGRKLIPEDEPNFLHGWTLCIVETDGPHDDVGTKVLLPIALAEGQDRDAAVEMVRAACRTQGATAFAANRVLRYAKRERLWCEPLAPDVIVACWFPDADVARKAFRSTGKPADLIRSISRKASAVLCDPLKIL